MGCGAVGENYAVKLVDETTVSNVAFGLRLGSIATLNQPRVQTLQTRTYYQYKLTCIHNQPSLIY